MNHPETNLRPPTDGSSSSKSNLGVPTGPKFMNCSSESSEADRKNTKNIYPKPSTQIPLKEEPKIQEKASKQDDKKKTIDTSSDSESHERPINPFIKPLNKVNQKMSSSKQSDEESGHEQPTQEIRKIPIPIQTIAKEDDYKEKNVSKGQMRENIPKTIIPVIKDILENKPVLKNRNEVDDVFKGKTLDLKKKRENLKDLLSSSDDSDDNKKLITNKEVNDENETLKAFAQKKGIKNNEEKIIKTSPVSEKVDKNSNNKVKNPNFQFIDLSKTEHLDKFQDRTNIHQKNINEFKKLSNEKKSNNDLDLKSNKDSKKNEKKMMTLEENDFSDSEDNQATMKINIKRKGPPNKSSDDDNYIIKKTTNPDILKKENNKKVLKKNINEKKLESFEEKKNLFENDEEIPDKRICYKSEIKLPSKIKKILLDKRIGGESWTYYESLNKYLNKFYEKFEEPVSDVGKFKEFITVNEKKLSKKSKEIKKLSINFALYRDIKKVSI